jgi:predicted amidohydrolase YtcJ
MPPTLILHNAAIVANPAAPELPRPSAIALFHDRVAMLGDDATIRALANPQTVSIDAGGRLVLPGFVDSHIHLLGYAQSLRTVALGGAHSLDEVLARVVERARKTPPDEWLFGRGWLQNQWSVPEMPNRHALDRVLPDRPVSLTHMDGHTMWLNSAALGRLGIDAHTPDPEGGQIERGPDGTPTGLLREAALDLVYSRLPEPSVSEAADLLRDGLITLNHLGITGAHDQRGMDVGALAWQALSALHQAGRLTVRTITNISPTQLPHLLAAGVPPGLGDDWLRIGWLKTFADGTLNSRTALMLEPFEGEPHNCGMAVHQAEEIYEWAHQAAAAGIPTSVHAIGDRANRQILDLFASLRERFGVALRHKIEHVQLIHPDDLPRLAALDVAASMQTVHIADDWRPADRFWGQRARYAYAVRSLLDQGVTLALGSDAPVACPNPFWGLYTAITRQDLAGEPQGGWYPEERLTIEEAITAYTIGPARVAGHAERLGRLLPGYLADLIVLDRDITTTDPAALKDTQVLLTIVGGQIAHRAL